MRRLFILGLLIAPLVSQQKVGPVVGLRVPVWDYSTNRWVYLKPNVTVSADPQGTSDGIMSAASSTAYEFGTGLVVEGNGATRKVYADRSYMMYRLPEDSMPMPAVGSACATEGTGALWLGTGGTLCYCVRSEALQARFPDAAISTGWVWACGSLLMRGPE